MCNIPLVLLVPRGTGTSLLYQRSLLYISIFRLGLSAFVTLLVLHRCEVSTVNLTTDCYSLCRSSLES